MSRARPAPRVLEDSLPFNIYRCALLLRRELVQALARYQLTPEGWHVLAVLDEAGEPVSQTEIVQALMKDPPTVTRILQRMERDGWVHRFTPSGNARVTLVEQTPDGARLTAKVPGLLSRQLAPVLDRLSPRATDDLVGQLRLLRQWMGDEWS